MFYKLGKPPNAVSLEWADGEVVPGEDNICPKYGDAHFLGNLRGGDLIVNLPSSNVKDFTWTWYSEMIVTDNTLKILKAAKLTGFQIRPVTVRKIKRKSDKPVPSLWEIVINGRGGDADPSCGIRLKYKCEHCRYRVYSPYQDNGIIVEPKNWDGSDFFNVNGYPKYILVTERVKEVIEKNKLKGCVLIPSTEIKHRDFFKKLDVKITDKYIPTITNKVKDKTG